MNRAEESRDPTIDGSLWGPLTQEELKQFIVAQRGEINTLKSDVRALCHLLRKFGNDLTQYGENNDPDRRGDR